MHSIFFVFYLINKKFRRHNEAQKIEGSHFFAIFFVYIFVSQKVNCTQSLRRVEYQNGREAKFEERTTVIDGPDAYKLLDPQAMAQLKAAASAGGDGSAMSARLTSTTANNASTAAATGSREQCSPGDTDANCLTETSTNV